jgi:hypothetical protein
MTTDTSEKGLESLIMRYMTGTDGLEPAVGPQAAKSPTPCGSGWIATSLPRLAMTAFSCRLLWLRYAALNRATEY